ncbi:MAG: sensor histidine kinase [Myxococcaceae bacterium]
MPETLFEELKRYVGFGDADEAALRALSPVAAPQLPRVVDAFYERILAHEAARKVLEKGESQVGHLKVTLMAWADKLLKGPWDEAYFQVRCRIGRVHVRIALPQHYMFSAMNILRTELSGVIDQHHQGSSAELRSAQRALGKILDLELAILLHTYREDSMNQLARRERLATFGQLVGSIGHELRNPLGVIETSLFILKDRVEEDEKDEKHLVRIREQVGIANGIISNLLDMIRDKPIVHAPVALRDVMESARDAVARPAGLQLTLEGIAELPAVRGDPVQLRQVFVNLLENAVDAAGPEGVIRIIGTRDARGVTVALEDNGPGVDSETLPRLFEPLVTRKPTGIGLGLALVKRIVERHEGTVRYEQSPAGGARFIVQLPCVETP